MPDLERLEQLARALLPPWEAKDETIVQFEEAFDTRTVLALIEVAKAAREHRCPDDTTLECPMCTALSRLEGMEGQADGR